MDSDVLVFIILIFVCCICIIVNVYSYKDNIYTAYISSLALIVITSSLVGISMHITINEANDINPLDVYRNKTELQITYKIINNDTISCDSIVVFKNK